VVGVAVVAGASVVADAVELVAALVVVVDRAAADVVEDAAAVSAAPWSSPPPHAESRSSPATTPTLTDRRCMLTMVVIGPDAARSSLPRREEVTDR
jgi:hypothetical protein